MNGILLVEGASADGSVLFPAKSQTVDIQSYDAYAWDSHVFGDDTIPVEICYNGSGYWTTEVTVLIYGVPYIGTVSVQSAARRDEAVKLKGDTLSGPKIQDLREGLFITVQAENGVTLVGSYIIEDYPMFSLAYLSGLSNLFLLMASFDAGGGSACLICAGFRKYRWTPAYPCGHT